MLAKESQVDRSSSAGWVILDKTEFRLLSSLPHEVQESKL